MDFELCAALLYLPSNGCTRWHTLCSHHIKSPTFLDFHDKQTAFHKRDESALSNSNFAKHVLKLFKRWAPLTFAHVYFSTGSHIILL